MSEGYVTPCAECKGTGDKVYGYAGSDGARAIPEKCRSCKGRGLLPVNAKKKQG